MNDEVWREMVEEFLPKPPRTLQTCWTLRKAGYTPHSRMRIMGRDLEVISYPFPQDGVSIRGGGCGIGIMVREPDDPTTMFEWSIPVTIVRMAIQSFG